MESQDTFESMGEAAARPDREAFVVDLDGFEGPIDVLLSLARDQKVDLTQISILQLADQYLDFVARARQISIELAADYLVMAAWLAYLKSRLLIPDLGGDDEPSGEEMAAALAFHLQRLEAMQEAGARLMAHARVGHEVFARGMPEVPEEDVQTVFEVTLMTSSRPTAINGNVPARERCKSRRGAFTPSRMRWNGCAGLSVALRIGKTCWPSCRPALTTPCSGVLRSPRPSWRAWNWCARGA